MSNDLKKKIIGLMSISSKALLLDPSKFRELKFFLNYEKTTA